MSSRGPKGRHAGNSACLGQPPPVQIRMGAFCSCLYPFLIAIFIQIHLFKALFVFCKSGIAEHESVLGSYLLSIWGCFH